MAMLRISHQCHEGNMTVLGVEWFDEADHDACPGGHTTPGVMGGWVCSCECHRAKPKEHA